MNLEESIEACGEHFGSLIGNPFSGKKTRWEASSVSAHKDYAHYKDEVCGGSTPSEAVDKLFDVLRKKEII